MCVLISSTAFVWDIYHSKKNWARYDKKFILVFTSSTSYFCQILMILQFSEQIFEKYSIWNLNFWNQSFTFNSNKSPTWCNSFSVYYPEVCLQLNMFRAFSHPSSGAQWLQWQPLVLPRVIVMLCSWLGRLAGLTTNTTWLSPRYEGKTRACHCSHWAPDDGRENARNTSCKQTSG
jgi:hypothetical protein